MQTSGGRYRPDSRSADHRYRGRRIGATAQRRSEQRTTNRFTNVDDIRPSCAAAAVSSCQRVDFQASAATGSIHVRLGAVERIAGFKTSPA